MAESPQPGPPAPAREGAAPEIRDDARGAAQELEDKAKQKARELRDEAARGARRWTASFGRQTESLARALRAARDSLWVEGEERMADMVGQAADQVDRVGTHLEEDDPSAMLRSFTDLGRRNPAAFLGAALALGLLVGRFLRASERPEGDGRIQEHEAFEHLPAAVDPHLPAAADPEGMM